MKQIRKWQVIHMALLFNGENSIFIKTKKDGKIAKLYSRNIDTGVETLVFDPETYKKMLKYPISILI